MATEKKVLTDRTAMFIAQNFKTLCTIFVFAIGFYIQHMANTAEINRLKQENVRINEKLDEQYAKLDNLKLDKAVFEATLRQFGDMSNDIREIRKGMEDLMKRHYAERGG